MPSTRNKATEKSGKPAKLPCFTAMGDGAQPSQGVFDGAGRSGNGPTWHAILRQVLTEKAQVGRATVVEEMGFGWQHEVVFQGRTTWIGFDVEAGGAVFCSRDQELLEELRTAYEQARRDPDTLRGLIARVPPTAWDD